MGGHYEKGIMRQLEELMLRCDKQEEEIKKIKANWKKEVQQVKADFAVERKAMKGEIKSLKSELASVKDENKVLKKRIVELENENSRLRSIINNDSNNSSLPPSTDQKGGKAANKYNNRTKSKKSQGGQCGHGGTTLSVSEVKKKIECGDLKREILDIGDKTKNYKVRYVIDLKIEPIVKEIRIHADECGNIIIPAEFRNPVTYGDVIKTMAVQLYADGVVANDRIANFINCTMDNKLHISNGSIYNFLRSFSKKSADVITDIEKKLAESELIHTDATNVTVNGKQAYVRNQSTSDTVLYNAMDSKSKVAIREQTILGNYQGILIHDHEKALYSYGTEHGECNVHLLRYLKKNSEETKNEWSEKLSKLLVEYNNKRKTHIADGTWFTATDYENCEKEYDKILKSGYRQNQKTEHKYAKTDELALLKRLEEYKENHLMFIRDNRVPFDNNLSERDLRKCKNRQKMAGGFRTSEGHEMYCIILSVIETFKRQGKNIYEGIKKIFVDATPAFA